MKECCGTCRYHVRGEIPGEWVCNNAESENYALETGFADSCLDYEGRNRE